MQQALQIAGDIGFCEQERFAGNANDLFIQPTTHRGRELGMELTCYVDTDDRVVAVVEFQDVRTTAQSNRLYTIGMGIRAESANDVHDAYF